MEAGSGWSCLVCTFINEASATVCDVCGSAHQAAAPDAAASPAASSPATSQPAAQPGSSALPGAAWACDACTYVNSNPVIRSCEICGTRRPGAQLASPTPQQVLPEELMPADLLATMLSAANQTRASRAARPTQEPRMSEGDAAVSRWFCDDGCYSCVGAEGNPACCVLDGVKTPEGGDDGADLTERGAPADAASRIPGSWLWRAVCVDPDAMRDSDPATAEKEEGKHSQALPLDSVRVLLPQLLRLCCLSSAVTDPPPSSLFTSRPSASVRSGGAAGEEAIVGADSAPPHLANGLPTGGIGRRKQTSTDTGSLAVCVARAWLQVKRIVTTQCVALETLGSVLADNSELLGCALSSGVLSSDRGYMSCALQMGRAVLNVAATLTGPSTELTPKDEGDGGRLLQRLCDALLEHGVVDAAVSVLAGDTAAASVSSASSRSASPPSTHFDMAAALLEAFGNAVQLSGTPGGDALRVALVASHGEGSVTLSVSEVVRALNTDDDVRQWNASGAEESSRRGAIRTAFTSSARRLLERTVLPALTGSMQSVGGEDASGWEDGVAAAGRALGQWLDGPQRQQALGDGPPVGSPYGIVSLRLVPVLASALLSSGTAPEVSPSRLPAFLSAVDSAVARGRVGSRLLHDAVSQSLAWCARVHRGEGIVSGEVWRAGARVGGELLEWEGLQGSQYLLAHAAAARMHARGEAGPYAPAFDGPALSLGGTLDLFSTAHLPVRLVPSPHDPLLQLLGATPPTADTGLAAICAASRPDGTPLPSSSSWPVLLDPRTPLSAWVDPFATLGELSTALSDWVASDLARLRSAVAANIGSVEDATRRAQASTASATAGTPSPAAAAPNKAAPTGTSAAAEAVVPTKAAPAGTSAAAGDSGSGRGATSLSSSTGQPQTTVKRVPVACRFFARGACNRGDGCRFSHAAPASGAVGRGTASASRKPTQSASHTGSAPAPALGASSSAVAVPGLGVDSTTPAPATASPPAQTVTQSHMPLQGGGSGAQQRRRRRNRAKNERKHAAAAALAPVSTAAAAPAAAAAAAATLPSPSAAGSEVPSRVQPPASPATDASASTQLPSPSVSASSSSSSSSSSSAAAAVHEVTDVGSGSRGSEEGSVHDQGAPAGAAAAAGVASNAAPPEGEAEASVRHRLSSAVASISEHYNDMPFIDDLLQNALYRATVAGNPPSVWPATFLMFAAAAMQECVDAGEMDEGTFDEAMELLEASLMGGGVVYDGVLSGTGSALAHASDDEDPASSTSSTAGTSQVASAPSALVKLDAATADSSLIDYSDPITRSLGKDAMSGKGFFTRFEVPGKAAVSAGGGGGASSSSTTSRSVDEYRTGWMSLEERCLFSGEGMCSPALASQARPPYVKARHSLAPTSHRALTVQRKDPSRSLVDRTAVLASLMRMKEPDPAVPATRGAGAGGDRAAGASASPFGSFLGQLVGAGAASAGAPSELLDGLSDALSGALGGVGGGELSSDLARLMGSSLFGGLGGGLGRSAAEVRAAIQSARGAADGSAPSTPLPGSAGVRPLGRPRISPLSAASAAALGGLTPARLGGLTPAGEGSSGALGTPLVPADTPVFGRASSSPPPPSSAEAGAGGSSRSLFGAGSPRSTSADGAGVPPAAAAAAAAAVQPPLAPSPGMPRLIAARSRASATTLSAPAAPAPHTAATLSPGEAGPLLEALKAVQSLCTRVAVRGLWFACHTFDAQGAPSSSVSVVWGPVLFDHTVAERLALSLGGSRPHAWRRVHTVTWGTLGPHPMQRPPAAVPAHGGSPAGPGAGRWVAAAHDRLDSGLLHVHAHATPLLAPVVSALGMPPRVPRPVSSGMVPFAALLRALRAAAPTAAGALRAPLLDRLVTSLLVDPLAVLSHAMWLSAVPATGAYDTSCSPGQLWQSLALLPSLVSLPLRTALFQAVAFGVRRAIAWSDGQRSAYAAERRARALQQSRANGGPSSSSPSGSRARRDPLEADDDDEEDDDGSGDDGVSSRLLTAAHHQLTIPRQRAVVSRRKLTGSAITLFGPRSSAVSSGSDLLSSTLNGSVLISAGPLLGSNLHAVAPAAGALSSSSPPAVPSMPVLATLTLAPEQHYALASDSTIGVQFSHEAGHGIGPTVEFFALTCRELHRKALGLWVDEGTQEDDEPLGAHGETSPGGGHASTEGGKGRASGAGPGSRAPGSPGSSPSSAGSPSEAASYVFAPGGFHPVPLLPPLKRTGDGAVVACASAAQTGALRSLELCGRIAGKALSEGRLVDLPLSDTLLRAAVKCGGGGFTVASHARKEPRATLLAEASSVAPSIGRSLQHLHRLLRQRDEAVVAVRDAGAYRCPGACDTLLSVAGDIDALSLDFTFPGQPALTLPLLPVGGSEPATGELAWEQGIPPASEQQALALARACASTVGAPWEDMPGARDATSLPPLGQSRSLPVPSGSSLPVTCANLHVYVDGLLDALLGRGLALPALALHRGLSAFLPSGAAALSIFAPAEARELMCGSEGARDDSLWTPQAIAPHITTTHGYKHDSPQITALLHTLSLLTVPQRRLFLRFLTGSGSLPSGGWAALSPRVTVVRTVPPTRVPPDDLLPTCSTCQLYLKLPAYSTQAVLQAKLLLAITEGQEAFSFD